MTVMHAPSLMRGILSSGETVSLPRDVELLEAFRRGDDAEAFAAIVHRYGSLVLQVCRRVLRNQHDAEDAFQASFLVFYHKAGSLRQSASLGSFLHGIAYRTAQNLLRLRQRRQVHEAASGWNRTSTHDQHAWFEVQAVLDREIQLLPALYRDVFIHCCLERQSRADVAKLLGVKEGTLSSRLMQAKKLLQERLTAQGISLATLLGTISLTESAASPLLLEQAVRGIAGTATLPAQVLALARPVMSERLLLTPLFAIGLVVALIVGVALAIQPDAKVLASPEPVVQPITTPQGGPLLSATGTVVTPDGKPLAGATVYLREWSDLRATRAPSEILPGNDLIAKTTSDATGHFAFKNVQAPATPSLHMRNASPYEVLVMAKGYAPAWQHLTPPLQKQPLLMQLGSSGTIQGTIKNAKGEPAAGAVVRVLDVGPLRRGFYSSRRGANVLLLNKSAIKWEKQVDEQGHFLLNDLPQDSCVCLEVRYQDCNDPPLYVAVSKTPQPDLSQVSYTTDQLHLQHEAVLISPLEVTLSARHQLTGTIVADDTGKPLPQANVLLGSGTSSPEKCDVDAQGVFHVSATLDGKATLIASGGKQHSAYLYKAVNLSKAVTNPLVIRLERGQLISGTVVDAVTQLPAKNARVTCIAEKENRGNHPTNEEGQFVIYAPVGKVRLSASRTGRDEFLVLDLTRDKPITGLKLLRKKEKPKATVQGRILDPQGNAVEGASVCLGNTSQRGQRFEETTSDRSGHFSFALEGDIHDRDDAELVVMHEQKQWGSYFSLTKEVDTQAVEIRLAPLASISGRVLDPDGKPIRNASVVLWSEATRPKMIEGLMRNVTNYGSFDHQATVTDADGKYRLVNIISGQGSAYQAHIACKGYTSSSSRKVQSTPGEHADTGDVPLYPTTESIAGTVVDSQGNPRANVHLFAVPASRQEGITLQGTSGSLVTKADGKFYFCNLPKGQIHLYWELLKPGTEYANRVYPIKPSLVDAGKMDMRLVIE